MFNSKNSRRSHTFESRKMELLRPMIGWLYLWMKYRNKKKIKHILHNEYEGSYDLAGAEVVMSTALIILIAGLVLFIVFVIAISIRDLIK